MTLSCVICMRVREGDPDDAVTVANGHAVCRSHLDYVILWHDLETAASVARGNEPPSLRK